VGNAETEPSQVSDTQIGIALGEPPFAAGTLRAGIVVVQVVHYEEIGDDRRLVPTAESNMFPLVFRPSIVGPPAPAAGPAVSLKVSPPVRAGQRISIELLPTGGGKSRSFQVTSPAADTDTLLIQVPGTPLGEYLVRLRVDGADSPLIADDNPASPTYQQFISPKVVFV
jgi:hypothetical protein